MRHLHLNPTVTAPARPGVFDDPRACTVLGFLSAVLAVLVIPVVFGGAAVALGVTAHRGATGSAFPPRWPACSASSSAPRSPCWSTTCGPDAR
ncbi:MAG TPA: hypothetical protein VNA20_11530 [Frankiaceae bacterium]|nr:hypothetical protein [Frankiaceae bacterium]